MFLVSLNSIFQLLLQESQASCLAKKDPYPPKIISSKLAWFVSNDPSLICPVTLPGAIPLVPPPPVPPEPSSPRQFLPELHKQLQKIRLEKERNGKEDRTTFKMDLSYPTLRCGVFVGKWERKVNTHTCARAHTCLHI